MDDTEHRKLRSNSREDESGLQEQTGSNAQSSLFKFDLGYELPDYDRPLKLVFKGSKLNRDFIASNSRYKCEIVKVNPPSVLNDGTLKDPLADELFLGYHRRMEREEKRDQTIERERGAMELERMTTQLEQLRSPNWRYHLCSITEIINVGDKYEMETKRDWTIVELEQFIEKYKVWRRNDVLIRKQDHLEMDMFQQGKEVVAPPPAPPPEPDLSLKVRKMAKPRASRRANEPFVSFYKNPTRRLSFDQLVARKCRSDLWAFGQAIPPIERQWFDLPETWKTSGDK